MSEAQLLVGKFDGGGSEDAAERLVQSGELNSQMKLVLKMTQEHPNSSSREIAAEINDSTRHIAGRRLPDLWRKGYVTRVEGRDRLGHKAFLWTALAETDPRFKRPNDAVLCECCGQVIDPKRDREEDLS